MKFSLHFLLVIGLLSRLTQPGQCLIQQAPFGKKGKKYLANHVIESTQTGNELECAMYCVRHGSCASVNYKVSGVGKGLCELNNKTIHEASGSDEETKFEFNHLYIIKKVSNFTSYSFLILRFQTKTNPNRSLFGRMTICELT